ncbi:unnamed protein product [Ranitomeya imitator]|uniref:Reverse transcriptase n=1 Tax=Ranitomeya imitator TaxID=111125 RepID=A0ABN9LZB1_9NEOB|nr:unnamed protein product [Ranitomeya imitator]
MGKTSDLTDVKKAIIDTLKQEGKTQKEISQQIGCSQSAVSRHLNGKSVGRKQCGRKRCTTRRGDRTLRKIVEKDRFQTLGNLRKQWTESGVETSRATVHRHVQEMGYRCRIPQGRVNAASYQEILEHFMLPSAEMLYGDEDFIFQHDLAPAHSAKTTACLFVLLEALRRKGCTAVPLVRHDIWVLQDTAVDMDIQGLCSSMDNLVINVQKIQDIIDQKSMLEPRIPIPDLFFGDRTKFLSFKNNCKLFLALKPHSSGNSVQQVLIIISFLRGDPQDWAFSLAPGDPALSSVDAFFLALGLLYDEPNSVDQAEKNLLALCQGQDDIEVYCQKFRKLSVLTLWNESALAALFRKGLSEALKDVMVGFPMPAGLNESMSLAIQIGRCLHERKSVHHLAVLSEIKPEPMQCDRTMTRVERQEHRRLNGLCFYCGDSTHAISDCPKRTKRFDRSAVIGTVQSKFLLSITLICSLSSYSVMAFVDSGAALNLMDLDYAKRCGFFLEPLRCPIPLRGIDATPLAKNKPQYWTQLTICMAPAHQEVIRFLVLHNLHDVVVLGLPWLQTHNPVLDWNSMSVSSWGCQGVHGDVPFLSISSSTPSEVPEFLSDYQDVFEESKSDALPPHRDCDCAINLIPGSKFPKGRLFNLSVPEHAAMRSYVKEFLEKGHIRPSSSPLGAGFFFVAKKDGSLRPCIDYRLLNKITVKFQYPLPLLSDLFARIKGASWFTKIDLRGAYNLVRIRQGDEWKTAFNTPEGHYEYLVMPFGLANAPSVFQSFIHDIFREYLDKFLIVYLDDILIFSDDWESHVKQVRMVFQVLRANSLFVKGSKCLFGVQKVSFLGFIFSPSTIEMDPVKVQAIQDWTQPTSLKSLQKFLGFANFYRRFICNFSSIAKPLTDLTKKGADLVNWSSAAAVEAFQELKRRFCSAPVLCQPDVSLPFQVEVDASEIGAGAVLSQRGSGCSVLKPCAFFSRKFSAAERNYDVGNRELLAMKWAFEEWRHWLEGAKHRVVVLTDHKNLTYLESAKRLNPRQARWSLFFARFDFVISYLPGSKNVKADALSRSFVPDSPGLSEPASILKEGVIVSAISPDLRRVLQKFQANKPDRCPAEKNCSSLIGGLVKLSLNFIVRCWLVILESLHVVRLHGIPENIVSDRGSQFVSRYVLLHHVMGELEGKKGSWGYVEGGMGTLSNAIAKAADESGAEIYTEKAVEQILVDDKGKAAGVVLQDGTEIHSRVVLSNATPHLTFLSMTPKIGRRLRERQTVHHLAVLSEHGPEPMQCDRTLTRAEWQEHRRQNGLCFYCGDSTHAISDCPKRTKRFARSATIGTVQSKFLLSITLICSLSFYSVMAFVDSGAALNLMDLEFARRCGFFLEPLQYPIPLRGIDATPLAKNKPQYWTQLTMCMAPAHQEDIRFLVLHNLHDVVVLGLPWLQVHNPVLDWKSMYVSSWGCQGVHGDVPFLSISSSTPSEVPEFLSDYRDVFDEPKSSALPPHRDCDCAIDLIPGSKFPKGRLFNLSVPEHAAMRSYVKESLEKGHIRPSSSPLGAGFFFVAKKDGSLRPCIDYRLLNKITVKFQYSLPLLSDLFARIKGAIWFTKIDLRGAYNLVRIKQGDEWKTAFNTPEGHFEYLVKWKGYGQEDNSWVFASDVHAADLVFVLTAKLSFLSSVYSERLPEDFITKISQFDAKSPVTKINVAVDRLPNFLSIPNTSDGKPLPHHRCSIHLNSEEMQLLNNAYEDASKGRPSERPMIELCIPSSLDPTLAPPGCHVISIFSQYTPISSCKCERLPPNSPSRAFSMAALCSLEQLAFSDVQCSDTPGLAQQGKLALALWFPQRYQLIAFF